MLPAADNSRIINAVIQEAREKGIQRLTISGVAKRCNCSRQTLYYHHLGGMDRIIDYMVREDRDGFNDVPDGAPYWKRETYRIFRSLNARDEFFKEVYGTKYRQTLLASVKSHVRNDIVPDFLANHRRGDNPKEWDTLADILTHLFTGMFEECIGSDEAADPDEMMGVVERLCGASMHRMIDDYLAFSGAN